MRAASSLSASCSYSSRMKSSAFAPQSRFFPATKKTIWSEGITSSRILFVDERRRRRIRRTNASSSCEKRFALTGGATRALNKNAAAFGNNNVVLFSSYEEEEEDDSEDEETKREKMEAIQYAMQSWVRKTSWMMKSNKFLNLHTRWM